MDAFIIMQIGNEMLERVYQEAIIPAVKACNLNLKRVDKHTEGGLLKAEIVNFIDSAEIIIADLTNERPNCYLEIGYAMGIDKFRNLILTAREDHFPDNESYQTNGPKIHFDLIGYNIIQWKLENLDKFEKDLEIGIKRRLAIIKPAVSIKKQTAWNEEWIKKNHDNAITGIKKAGKKAYFEAKVSLIDKIKTDQSTLLNAARDSQIHTFGWPIGIVLNNENNPKPTVDGIKCEIDHTSQEFGKGYDYWALGKDGSFYILKDLFEDRNGENKAIYFNTRIIRVTELLMYIARLYDRLKVPADSQIIVGIKHVGFQKRILSSSNTARYISGNCNSVENEIYHEKITIINNVENNLPSLVREFIDPFFQLFDYFNISSQVIEDIVQRFINGEVS